MGALEGFTLVLSKLTLYVLNAALVARSTASALLSLNVLLVKVFKKVFIKS